MEREESKPQIRRRCLCCARTWNHPEERKREAAVTAQCPACGSLDTERLVNLQVGAHV